MTAAGQAIAQDLADRNTRLWSTQANAVTEQEYRQSVLAALAARKQIEQARANLKKAQTTLEVMQVRAQLAGRMREQALQVRARVVVAGNAAEAIAKEAQASDLIVLATHGRGRPPYAARQCRQQGDSEQLCSGAGVPAVLKRPQSVPHSHISRLEWANRPRHAGFLRHESQHFRNGIQSCPSVPHSRHGVCQHLSYPQSSSEKP